MVSEVAIFAALATAVTLGVLGWVLWPLWRRPRGPLLAATLVLGLAVLGVYRLVGTPAALHESALEAPQNLEEAVARLAAELERNPAQPEGWALLARSQAALGNHAAARDAYARALQLAPGEPSLLVDAAEARALADPQRRFDEQAVAWLQEALQLHPGHPRATWFLGVWQRQSRRPAEAAETWTSLLGNVDADTARSLRVQIDEARAEAGLPPLPHGGGAPGAPTLTVSVALDPALAERVRLQRDAVVFVIARVPGGPPMPVAVERHAASALPVEVVLDDGDSPMPTQTLSMLDEVEVFARISAGGSAERGEGDLETAPVRVRLPASEPVHLVIGSQAP